MNNKENRFGHITQELSQVDKELKNLGQIEKTFGDFLHNSVNELLKQKGLKNYGHIWFNRSGSSFNISFHLSEIEESRTTRVNRLVLPTDIAEGDLTLKQVKFSTISSLIWEKVPSYLKQEIIPFLGDIFQNCGFSIKPKELVQEIAKRKQAIPETTQFSEEKFEEVKKKFLEEIKKSPLPEGVYQETEAYFDQIISGVLEVFSLYGLQESLTTIDAAAKKLIKEKLYKEKNPHYEFASVCSHLEEVGVFQQLTGYSLILPFDERDWEEKPFYKLDSWKEDTKKYIFEDVLPIFKNENPENKKRLEDVFVVAKDLIRSL